jgi:cysteine synthase A
MPIIEATSANTGIALSALGSYYGHDVYIFMPDWASKERVSLMESYGAKVTLISKEDGGFIRCVEESKKLAKELNGFLANQFSNKDNYLAHYETTAEEIVRQLPENPKAFISGIGTGGTLMGTGTRLKEEFEDFKIIALEPDKMPIVSKGKVLGSHKIEGIGDDFVPDLVDKTKIDDYILINDEDAINMSRILAKKMGIGVGISSGANLIASVIAENKLHGPVVTVFADDNKKYLSTDMAKGISNEPSFISNKIKLIDYEIV